MFFVCKLSAEDPKVSIIVPVYNTERYLNECIDNLKNQTLNDIEMIFVDDGSSDNSLDILKDQAQKDSRSIGIEQAS